jgi:hypothetical protein
MTYKTFFKSVYAISSNSDGHAKLIGKRAGKVYVYTAPDDCIIAHIGATYLHVVTGYKIEPQALKNLIGFALNQKLPVKLERCEGVKNLQAVDRIVTRINAELGFSQIIE